VQTTFLLYIAKIVYCSLRGNVWNYSMTASDSTPTSQIAWQAHYRYGLHTNPSDTTTRLRADDELRLHSEIIRHMAGGVTLTRISDGVIVYSNPRLAQMLGYTPGEITGQHIALTKSDVSKEEITEQIMVEVRANGMWTGDVEMTRRDGSTIWCHTTISLVEHQQHGQFWLSVYVDITKRRQQEESLRDAHALLQAQMEELREQSIRDPLTHLYNRRYLHETTPREVARSLRDGYDLAILMIDIDYFKQINDRYGHLAGDVALQAVAQMIQSNLRASDIACRYGGEEILCLLTDTTMETALRRAEDLRLAVASHQIIPAFADARVTISVGVAVYPSGSHSIADVIWAADQALYRAKSDGRNCVRLAAAREVGGNAFASDCFQ
jgi:diguanylate cyclase (GGDEF)-like protein/PAS domain S-box-containing protein